MSGHTSGPWLKSTIGRRNDGSIAVMSKDGPVAYANLLRYVKRGTAHSINDAESESNARLIAAAPELLEALKRCAELLDDYSDVNDGEDGPRPNRAMSLLTDVEDAIAKAEGREP